MHLRRPTTPRVAPIPRVLDRAKERASASGSAARPFNMQATLHHNREVSKALGDLSAVFFNPAVVDPRLREISILRMAWNTGCEYEFGQHRLIGRNAGLTEAEVVAVTRPVSLGQWAPEEAAVIQMVDDLYIDDCVGDSTWEELVKHFDTAAVIGLMGAPLCYRMAAGIFNSLGIELDTGVAGWSGNT
jgi:4-carboxymuconolactone decarboxylase